MRLIVCGRRSFANFELIERELTRLNSNKPISVLIHGWIGPAASVIEHWARENDIPMFAIRRTGSCTARGPRLGETNSCFATVARGS
jgi:hypothetical protein